MKNKEIYVSLIPRSTLIKRFEKTPAALEINHKAWENYWEEKKEYPHLSPDWEDALTINWWEEEPIRGDAIGIKVDDLMKRAPNSHEHQLHWTKSSWFQGTVNIWIAVENEYVKEVVISTTGSRMNSGLLHHLLTIFEPFDVLLMDKAGFLLESSIDSIKKLAH